ncbi:MAG: hypothetical protein SXA11_04950 [Cyanobacteriota bacterium]|nr:hypothetical protein [Cyanobacteriota bacterium]
MMTPEEIIAAFLQVWEIYPEWFLAADVEKDLDSLNREITSSPDAPNESMAEEIREWCKEHSNIRDAVLIASRKLRPENNVPTRENENSKILDNRYPQISKTLRDRLPKDSEKENQNK